MKINAQKKESFYNFPFLYNENPALDAGFSLYKQKGTPSSAFLKIVRFCFAIMCARYTIAPQAAGSAVYLASNISGATIPEKKIMMNIGGWKIG